MIPAHHPADETLLSYAAGTLDAAAAAIVSCHLDWCPECRRRARGMELIGAVMMEQLPPAPADASTAAKKLHFKPVLNGRPNMDAVIYNGLPSEDFLPRPLARFTSLRRSTLPWRDHSPGLRHFKLPVSGRGEDSLSFYNVAPGRSIDEFLEDGFDLTFVLWGALADERDVYRSGDMHDAGVAAARDLRTDGAEGCTFIAARS